MAAGQLSPGIADRRPGLPKYRLIPTERQWPLDRITSEKHGTRQTPWIAPAQPANLLFDGAGVIRPIDLVIAQPDEAFRVVLRRTHGV